MPFKKLMHRLTTTAVELDEEQLREFCAGRPGVLPIHEIVPRRPFTAVGEIFTVRIVPNGSTQWLEATISDGTGKMVVMWMGRRSIPGIKPGRRMVWTGRASANGPGGRLLVHNPRYELL